MYGFGGNALAAVGAGLLSHPATGDPVVVYVWNGLAVGVGTALIAVGKRLLGGMLNPRPFGT